MNWLKVCLAAQVLLLTLRLNLLDLWTDELFTLRTAALPVPDILRTVAADIHPPLYYLLQHFWLAIPIPLPEIERLRILSVIFTLGTTIVLDRLFASRLPERWRRWLLLLWVVSPCLVLYGRMARSYSLQVLVVLVATYYAFEFAERATRRGMLLLAGWIAITFYTHYVPGLAVAAATAVLLASRRRVRDLAAVGGLAFAAYLPWVWVMAQSLGKWAKGGSAYALTGGGLTEVALKAGFATVSFSMGESQRWWGFAGGALLLPVLVWLVVEGARRRSTLAVWGGVVAAVGFLGVAGWVSYPFIPARLLFLLPFALLLLAAGCETRPRIGVTVCGLVLMLWLAGLWTYFLKVHYLNKGYAVPFAGMVTRLQPADAPVFCDTLNTDSAVIQHYLGPKRPIIPIGGADTPRLIAQAAADPNVRAFWIVRNGHDISPGRVNTQVESELARTWRMDRTSYMPLSPFEQGLARFLTRRDPPRFFYVVTRFRR